MIIIPRVPVLVERSNNAETSDAATHQMGLNPNARFRPEPMKRREDGSTKPLLMGEGLFDLAAANVVAERCIPPGMIVEACSKKSREKKSLLKQAAIVSASVTVAMEEDFIRLVQEHNELEDLAESRLQRIQILEYQLNNENNAIAQLHQDLKTTRKICRSYKSKRKPIISIAWRPRKLWKCSKGNLMMLRGGSGY